MTDHTSFYFASCTPDGGIWQYRRNRSQWEPVGFTPMDRPMYMIISERKMYVLLLSPFDNGESGLISYDIAADGSLQTPSPIQSTHGEEACYLCADGKTIYAVNYTSGSVIRMPDLLVSHTGNSIHPDRQTEPHTHYVNFTPDGKYLLVTDLGNDHIYVYDKNLSLHSRLAIPVGHGPRHLAFHEDGRHIFCVNELASTVSLLQYTDGTLSLLDTAETLPQNYTGESTSAAVRCIGNTVYTSNRGHDSVSVLDFTGNRLHLRKTIPTYGRSPRDFIVYDGHILAANQNEDMVTVVSVENSCLTAQIAIKSPLCIAADNGQT